MGPSSFTEIFLQVNEESIEAAIYCLSGVEKNARENNDEKLKSTHTQAPTTFRDFGVSFSGFTHCSSLALKRKQRNVWYFGAEKKYEALQAPVYYTNLPITACLRKLVCKVSKKHSSKTRKKFPSTMIHSSEVLVTVAFNRLLSI